MTALFDSITGTGSIEALETRFRELVGTRFGIALCNATCALHAALLASGVKSGDEVIVPAYTWGGSITGVLQIGATPVFADIDETLTLDPRDVLAKITGKTKAVILVHLFGHPGYCFELRKICRDAGIILIEDCAQAFGAKDRRRPVGSFGIGCFSFSPGKILNVGEGAVLTTGDEDVYDRLLYYTQHPLRQRKDSLTINRLNQFALNYRLASPLAEAALAKLDGALQEISERTKAFTELSAMLAKANFAGLTPVSAREGVAVSWHRYSPALNKGITADELESIQTFLGGLGFRMQKGYIAEPLYRDAALSEYLPFRVRKKIRRLILPITELACQSRVGIERLD